MTFQPDGDMTVPPCGPHSELPIPELQNNGSDFEDGCPVWEGEEPHEYRVAITPSGRSLFKYCIYCDEMKLLDVTKLV